MGALSPPWRRGRAKKGGERTRERERRERSPLLMRGCKRGGVMVGESVMMRDRGMMGEVEDRKSCDEGEKKEEEKGW